MSGSVSRLLTGAVFFALVGTAPAFAGAGPGSAPVATAPPAVSVAGPATRPALRPSPRPAPRSVVRRIARPSVALPLRDPTLERRESVRARLASLLILGIGY